VIIVELTPSEMNLAKYHATRAEIGGVSRIRDLRERTASLSEDQLAGQVGTLAMHKFLHGHSQQYALGRYMQNKHPRQGDGGEDVLGLNLDVKTSVMRRNQDPYAYNLPVRPHEMHTNWVYALALLPVDFEVVMNVYLVGWASVREFPKTPETEGVFKGAHLLKAKDLTPFPPIKYSWF
jgi:hypothetical protein